MLNRMQQKGASAEPTICPTLETDTVWAIDHCNQTKFQHMTAEMSQLARQSRGSQTNTSLLNPNHRTETMTSIDSGPSSSEVPKRESTLRRKRSVERIRFLRLTDLTAAGLLCLRSADEEDAADLGRRTAAPRRGKPLPCAIAWTLGLVEGLKAEQGCLEWLRQGFGLGRAGRVGSGGRGGWWACVHVSALAVTGIWKFHVFFGCKLTVSKWTRMVDRKD
jgi:hypothetical protein